jgi:hypothetical protein
VDTDSYFIDPFLTINYVFPVNEIEHDVCSYLANIFLLTNPIRCDFIENIMAGYGGEGPKLSHRQFDDNNIVNGYIYYEMTLYGKIEDYLNNCRLEKIPIKSTI